MAALAGCAGTAAPEALPSETTAPGVELECLVGRYNGTATEIAATVALFEKGRFEYALIYGALDERAEGRWRVEDGKVLLTSDPVTPPELDLLRTSGPADGGLRFELDVPDWLSRQYFDAELTLRDGTREVLQFAEEGLDIAADDAVQVASVRVLLPIVGVASTSHRLDARGGRTLSYRFRPNDLGKVEFTDKALTIEPDSLVIERHDRRLRLFREGEPCALP